MSRSGRPPDDLRLLRKEMLFAAHQLRHDGYKVDRRSLAAALFITEAGLARRQQKLQLHIIDIRLLSATWSTTTAS